MPDKLPDLSISLQNKDAGFLHIVLELWGAELTEPSWGEATPGRAALQEQMAPLLESAHIARVVEALSPEARLALDDLRGNEGRLPICS